MKLFVCNLKFDTSEPELYEHFKSCVVSEVRIVVDRNGLTSIGFVTMKREQDAIVAIEKLNGTALSSTAARSPSRSRTGGEGYAMEDDSPLITPDALLLSQFADLPILERPRRADQAADAGNARTCTSRRDGRRTLSSARAATQEVGGTAIAMFGRARRLGDRLDLR